MSALCLIAWSLAMGQNVDRASWHLVGQFTPGLELVYRGTCTEQSLVPGVQHQREYAVEAIFLVDRPGPNCNEAVLQTSVRLSEPRTAKAKKGSPPAVVRTQFESAPGSVRLDLVQIDRRGRLFCVKDPDAPLAIPLNGPAMMETGAFFELPVAAIGPLSYWEEFEDHRPLKCWRVLGAEPFRSTWCIKLQCTQESADWRKPRADSTAWRRVDVIWFAIQHGLVYRVERTIERRAPARTEPTQRIATTFELESRFPYSGRLLEERKEEIAKIRKLQDDARPLLSQPAKFRGQIEGMLKRIGAYVAETAPTPYRKALAHLQSRLERARSGEVPADVSTLQEPAMKPALGVGDKVPDFVIADLTSLTPNNVRRFNDMVADANPQAVLVFYYDPTTETGKEILRFAGKLGDRIGDDLLILGMAVSDNVELVRRQHDDMDLSFPVLDGKAMIRTFGVDGTPRVIILDGDGVVHCAFTGWGYHSPAEVSNEIQRCLTASRKKQKDE